MSYNLRLIFSCIFEFFTCRKKPHDDDYDDDLLEYHRIYDNN